MKLHLVRHGQTRANAEGRIQGDRIDEPLDDVGRAQAEALARHYAAARADGLRVAAVYASPLLRARQTAESIADALRLPAPRALPGVREVSWGVHMGERNEGLVLDEMSRVLRAWDAGDLAARVEGGETPAEAWQRAMRDLAPVLERHADEEIVLVAHGRINKILLSGLVHGHLHHMERYPQSNACVNLLDGPTPWIARILDGRDHLAALPTLQERVS